MFGKFKWVFATFFLVVGSYSLLISPAQAAINSCTVSLAPTAVRPDLEVNFQLQINNTDTEAIRWIDIAGPASNLTVESAQASGWDVSVTADAVSLTNGSISPGGTLTVTITANIASEETSGASWSLAVSDDINGINASSCEGDLYFEISNSAGPFISTIIITSLTPSSVTVTWATDTATKGKVEYGKTASYGSATSLETNFSTSHRVTINNLSESTAYHYRISVIDNIGQDSISSDNTFLTPAKQASSTNPTAVVNSNDKKPPVIVFTSVPETNVQTSIPRFTGTASDDVAIMLIEFSTDGGQNWLPVDIAPKLGGNRVDFSFTPLNLDDGNYEIIARAVDAGGNQTSTTPVSIVIDRLPPIVGGNLISVGPQAFISSIDGTIESLARIDQKITLSAVGGPTSIVINARMIEKPDKIQSFTLTKSSDTGLWFGVLSFEEVGNYIITANAVDGAGNITERQLNTVNILPSGKVTKKGGTETVAAHLTVHYLEPESNRWVVWDGASYGQTNPQMTSKDGQFNLILPAGKYYLKATANGFRNLTTDIFEFKKPTPLSTTLTMDSGGVWKIGSLTIAIPNFSTQKMIIKRVDSNKKQSKFINKNLPDFSLIDTDAATVKPISWLGSPTLLSFGATWLPATSEQLSSLSELQDNPNLNIVPVALEENIARLRVYNSITGLKLTWLADPDGSLVNVFDVQSLPMHYFIDRKGVIRHVTSGVLDKQELLDKLTGL